MFTLYSLWYSDNLHSGRVDYHSLSEQTLMELLFENVMNTSILRDSNGYFLNIDDWPRIQMNESRTKVILIHMENVFEGGDLFDFSDDEDAMAQNIGPGSIDLKWVPREVVEFIIDDLSLSGTIETADLPRKLCSLNIARNDFTGTFDITHLRDTMRSIFCSFNKLVGTLDIPSLPANMKTFFGERNLFSGYLDLRKLPSQMKCLSLNNNKFSGSIDLCAVPDSLYLLELRGCEIQQEMLVVRVPSKGLNGIYLDVPRFEQILDTHGNDIRANFRQ